MWFGCASMFVVGRVRKKESRLHLGRLVTYKITDAKTSSYGKVNYYTNTRLVLVFNMGHPRIMEQLKWGQEDLIGSGSAGAPDGRCLLTPYRVILVSSFQYLGPGKQRRSQPSIFE